MHNGSTIPPVPLGGDLLEAGGSGSINHFYLIKTTTLEPGEPVVPARIGRAEHCGRPSLTHEVESTQGGASATATTNRRSSLNELFLAAAGKAGDELTASPGPSSARLRGAEQFVPFRNRYCFANHVGQRQRKADDPDSPESNLIQNPGRRGLVCPRSGGRPQPALTPLSLAKR